MAAKVITAEQAARAELLGEWLRFYREAIRLGSERPGDVADVLAFGRVGGDEGAK